MSTSTMPPPSTTAPDRDPAALLDVQAVAAMLDCSPRHIYRMSDGGKLPAPLKIGALVRWRADEIRAWISGGCKPRSH